MKKAIQIAYNGLFELKCKYAAEAGFKDIAVNFNNILDKTEDEWSRLTDGIGQTIERYGLSCNQSHLHCYNLLESSEIPDKRSDHAIRQAIIATGRLGAKFGVYHPRTSISTGYNVQSSFEDNRRIISELLDTAVKYNTGIAVENIPLFPDHPDMPFYSCDYRDLAALVDSFNDSRISVCWDFGHANLMYTDQRAALEYLGSRITCTHIHNNFGVHDDHASPDSGTADWYGIMPTLAKIGYNGCLTLESECKYTEPTLLRSFARHNFVCAEFLEGLMNTQNP